MHTLFVSYSRSDLGLCRRILTHLRPLEPEKIRIWFDGELRPGDDWRGELSAELDDAAFVILLLSPDFFASSFCRRELERAVEREARGRTLLIPVMVRPTRLPPSFQRQIYSLTELNDATLEEFVGEVERRIDANAGRLPETRLFHPNVRELTDRLHQLCDRIPQHTALYDLAQPGVVDPRKPFVIITQGTEEDAAERFLARLESGLLNSILELELKGLSPLQWPKSVAGKTPHGVFGPALAVKAKLRPNATLQEINNRLTSLAPLSLVPSTVSSDNWDRDNCAMVLDAYLQFWGQWAQAGQRADAVEIPEGHLLIPVLSVKYGRDESVNERIRQCLRAYVQPQDLPDSPAGILVAPCQGILLSPFTQVERQDMADWILEEQVFPLFRNPLEAIDRLHIVFPNDGASWRMKPLAETHFPNFVRQL